ncbi:hypothetical protein BB559_002327 [Furculomyces boomerangus]|uniref:Lysophospholipase NTE1 n=1 Tax=Furculomyces boomerangus TaxID=61424 RepID=A0A2T9YWH0_9FUNG|nr:hypothetical protein BB559_002327 [Furculomyces boomerangus]
MFGGLKTHFLPKSYKNDRVNKTQTKENFNKGILSNIEINIDEFDSDGNEEDSDLEDESLYITSSVYRKGNRYGSEGHNKYENLPKENMLYEGSYKRRQKYQSAGMGAGVSFLDTFLKSIQIFGYLEDAVFYELSRQLQTQRVLAGERLYGIEKRSDFCVVVDGCVRVYAIDENIHKEDSDRDIPFPIRRKSTDIGYDSSDECGTSDNMDFSSDEFEDNNENINYNPLVGNQKNALVRKKGSKPKQLIREVGKGNILSSLLQLLEIFTESIQKEEYQVSQTGLDKKVRIFGVAMVDTTLAVIPERAFRRVGEKFPKAAVHMIQVILTRLQRVSLATMQNYLNVQNDVMDFEQRLATVSVDNDLKFTENNNIVVNNEVYTRENLEEIKKEIRLLCFLDSKANLLDEKSSKNNTKHTDIKKKANNGKLSSNNSVYSGSLDNMHEYKNKVFNYNSQDFTFQNKSIGGTGLDMSTKLLDSKSILFLNEEKLEVLGLRNHENILKQKMKLVKNTSLEDNHIPTTSFDQDINTLPKKQEKNTSSDTKPKRDSLNIGKSTYKTPRIHDFEALQKNATQMLTKALGIKETKLGSLGMKKSVSLNKQLSNDKLDDNYSYSPSQMSGSEISGGFSSSVVSKPISVFPKIMFPKEVQTDNTTPEIPSPSTMFENLSKVISDYTRIIYVPQGKKIISKGQRPEGIFIVLDGILEISSAKNAKSSELFGGINDLTSNFDGNHWNSGDTNSNFDENAKVMTKLAYEVQEAMENIPDNDEEGTKKLVDEMVQNISGFGKNNKRSAERKQNDQKNRKGYKKSNKPNKFTSLNQDYKKRYQKTSRRIKRIGIGSIAGYFACITDMTSNVDVVVGKCYNGDEEYACGALLGFLPITSVARLVDEVPSVFLRLAQRVSNNLTSFIHHVDYALDWKRLKGGKMIYKMGNRSDAVHIVLSGRLRAVADGNINTGESNVVLAEYGYGESVGEADVLAGDKRSFSLQAIRDSELVWIPKTLFSILVAKYPKLTFHMSKLIAERMLRQMYKRQPSITQNQKWNSFSAKPKPNLPENDGNGIDKSPSALLDAGRYNSNLKTVCILPINDDVPIHDFSLQLYEALVESHGPNFALLESQSVLRNVGKNAFTRVGKLKTQSWLAELEEKRRMLLYVADGGMDSSWTLRCIRQADCILIVGLGDGDPSVGPYEQLVLATKSVARKELVLLHQKREIIPGSTRAWLNKRDWIIAHHHIQISLLDNVAQKRSKSFFSVHSSGNSDGLRSPEGVIANVISMLNLYWSENEQGVSASGINTENPSNLQNTPGSSSKKVDKKNSFGSLFDKTVTSNGLPGIHLTNATRGAIHKLKGRVKSYYERVLDSGNLAAVSKHQKIRSDFARLARRLCNQSVGLVMGGGGARGMALLGVLRAFEEAGIPIDIVGGTSIGAFFSGLYAHEPDSMNIWRRAKLFANHISSMWRTILDATWPVLSYTSGNEFNRALWKVFKETQIEDLWLPFYCVSTNITHSCLEVHTSGSLWRYCRASMSLSGFVPPLCDSDGQMLVDGGYLDNLPVDYMRHQLGANIIFAIDIAGEDDTSPVFYGEAVSGFRVTLNNINPFRRYRIPNLSEIQSRLAFASSAQSLRSAKSKPGVIYAKVPPRNLGVLEFSKFNPVYRKGYRYAKAWVEIWRNTKCLEQLFGHQLATKNGKKVDFGKNKENGENNDSLKSDYYEGRNVCSGYHSDKSTEATSWLNLRQKRAENEKLGNKTNSGAKSRVLDDHDLDSIGDEKYQMWSHFHALSDG